MFRFGIIGYGKRINAISNMALATGECELVAIADKDTQEVKRRFPSLPAGITYYSDAEDMLKSEHLDGVMIGTRCSSHTEYAVLVAKYGLPLFLEKPVCTTYEDLERLKGLTNMEEKTVVSFPLRTASIVERVKEIVLSDRIGELSQIQVYNNVHYGARYYHKWYRDVEETGGMFLQKATHDLDYVSYVTGLSPLCVCAMKSKKIFGGKRPAGLRCKDCPERESCPEASFVESCKNDVEVYDYCSFSEDVGIEDCGSIILEYETGVQGVYSQSFVTRHGAKKRGARFIGYKGTVEFDFYTGKITVYDHMNDTSETINVENGGSHFGGDKFLVNSFIEVMKHGTPSASPLSGGIISAETCLAARKSSEEHVFVKIENQNHA